MLRSTPRAGVVPLLAVTAMAMFPTTAGATSVDRAADSKTVTINDNIGIADRLEIDGAPDDSVSVTSTGGVPIIATPGPFCTQTSPTVVTCKGDSALRLHVSLGGGDDTFIERSGIPGTVIGGGDGNDTLTGGLRGDTLNGGPGNDRLDGANGNDILRGEAGDDFEIGGAGDDKIGAASIAQTTNADPGVDTLSGGLGRDELFATDGTADREINCHGELTRDFPGELGIVDLVDPQPRFCETVGQAFRDQFPVVEVRGRVVKVRAGRATVRLRCPGAAPGGSCAGTVKLVKKGLTLASGRYKIRAGRNRTVRLRLRRRASGRAEVRTRERDTEGRPETTRTAVVLRR